MTRVGKVRGNGAKSLIAVKAVTGAVGDGGGETRARSTPTTPSVFGTGLVALDVIISADPDRAPVFAAGGTCGNVMAGLSYLGWEAFPVARLNGDAASTIVRADLQRSGVALDFAMETPGTETPIVIQTIRRDRQGNPTHRYSLTCPGCGAWFPAFRAVTNEAALMVIDAVTEARHGGFTPPRVFFFDRVSRGALTLAQAFADRGALVVFEPVGVGDPKLFIEAIGLAHVVKYSHDRLPEFAERADPWQRRKDKRRGPFIEIETMAADGLRFRTPRQRNKWRKLDAITASKLLDTAGAGDWCTVGFLEVLGKDGLAGAENARVTDFEEALRFGQSAAAIACGYEGARGVMMQLSRTAFTTAVYHRQKLLQSHEGLHVGDALHHTTPPVERGARKRKLADSVRSGAWTGTVCPACPANAKTR